MVLASYPSFGNVLWTIIVFFAWVAWIYVLIVILADLFRRHDINGWLKALWCLFLIVVPFLGVLVYLIAEHKGMAERSEREYTQQKEATDSYIRSVSGGPSNEIAQAKDLLDKGAITQQEYDALKDRVLKQAA
jgi:general stress protein CsbA